MIHESLGNLRLAPQIFHGLLRQLHAILLSQVVAAEGYLALFSCLVPVATGQRLLRGSTHVSARAIAVTSRRLLHRSWISLLHMITAVRALAAKERREVALLAHIEAILLCQCLNKLLIPLVDLVVQVRLAIYMPPHGVLLLALRASRTGRERAAAIH